MRSHTKESWAETLMRFESVAALPLGWPKWPFRYFMKEVQGLWDATGSPARVKGVFDMTLEFDPCMKDMGTSFRAFVFAHEIYHMKKRHGFWLVVLGVLSLGILLLPVRRIFERDADREAARWLPPHLFYSAASTAHRLSHWEEPARGPISRLIYPPPLARMAAAYGISEQEASRWQALAEGAGAWDGA